MKIIKRNGTEVEFDEQKIISAISRANSEIIDESDKLLPDDIINIAKQIKDNAEKSLHSLSVEEIQDMVEDEIMKRDKYKLARTYITYRYKRSLLRQDNPIDKTILSIVDLSNEDIKQENSNKNPVINSTQRDYIAGEVSKDITLRKLLPKRIVEAHNQGILHFHDTDYFLQRMHNCDLVNLDDMLQNGTCISNTMIEKPHSFYTACNVTTQIIAQVASNQYGGQSINLAHLVPFIDISRKSIRTKVINENNEIGRNLSDEEINKIVEIRIKDEIQRGVQTIQYQILTLLTTNGQTPFITVFMYLNDVEEDKKDDFALVIEEMINQRYKGVKNEKGAWITPSFPKLIYVLEEDNIHKDSKYYYLTKLAAKCTAKRLVPDYISEKKMKELKDGYCFSTMGCRSNLAPWYDENGKVKFWGRFNMGVVTINLVDVACSSYKDEEKFWKIFDERLELCFDALMERYKRLKGTVSDVAPILWQYGAIARLEKGETIDKLLTGGYASISLGYAGLAECVYYMKGKSHTDPDATPFALDVMRYMNKKVAEWKERTNLGFSIYGSPIESTTYKLAKCLRKRFGIIEGVTDKNYITNSYHVKVTEEIDAFTKLKFESQFQDLSSGGAISYVEVPNMQNNIEAILSVIKFIYDNIVYAELNTKSDYCQCCGFDGEIEIKEDDNGKLIWKCPKCGNIDQNKMNVARRTCG